MVSGTLTSFNIEQIDTSYWKNVDEVLVKNEDMVKAEQLLLKTSNSEAKGEISSTIEGKFYVQEQGGKDVYFIYDLNNVGIEIIVDEEDSVKLKLGQKANVSFTGYNELYEGRVYYIQKIPKDEQIKIKIKLDYSDKLKFGTNAKVEILANESVDENVKEYDIKNNVTKMGKTKFIFKDSENNSVDMNEMFDMEALFQEYLNQMMNENDMENIDGYGELPMEFETEDGENIEDISEYWSEYWNNYWKAYYEEYQTFQVIEPSGILGDEDTDEKQKENNESNFDEEGE